MNRINLIALGVRDLVKAREFYRDGLGFLTTNNEPDPAIVFFNNGGTKLELYPLNSLAKDINHDNPPSINHGFAGVTLAYNAKSRAEVDAIFAKIEQIGGVIAKAPQVAVWGGYSGYFQDLDGYYWEVAYWDGWQFDDNEMLIIE